MNNLIYKPTEEIMKSISRTIMPSDVPVGIEQSGGSTYFSLGLFIIAVLILVILLVIKKYIDYVNRKKIEDDVKNFNQYMEKTV